MKREFSRKAPIVKRINVWISILLLWSFTVPADISAKSDPAGSGYGGIIQKITAGGRSSFVVKPDGTVAAWGDNSYGETNVPAGLSGVKAIASQAGNPLALKSDGTVVAWGRQYAPVPAGLNGVAAIAAGANHSLALKSDGSVVAWGTAIYGETNVPAGLSGVTAIAAGLYHVLALKSDGTVDAWGDNSYHQADVPAGLGGVVAIAAGSFHSLALKSDGAVVAWGYNNAGQATVPAGLKGVAAIAAGRNHSLALKSDGTVVAWGDNSDGQTDVPAGLKGVVAISAGYLHSLALKADGTIVAWGDNANGQTNEPAGLNAPVKGIAIDTGDFHSLALQSDGTVAAWGDDRYGRTSVPAGLGGAVAIAAGGTHSLALQSDGTVAAWGDNSVGATAVPTGLSGVTAIAAGASHSLALKADGTVVAWGYNHFGQTTVPAGLGGVVAIDAGDANSIALKSDGTVVAWGNNASGQTSVPAGLGGVVAIAAGSYHTLALKSNGTVVAWGDNHYGQLNVPAGLVGVVAIAAGDSNSLALKSDGTVVAWGNNGSGQSNVPAELSGVVAIAAGFRHSLALKADGTVVAWGSNQNGQTNVPGRDADLNGLTLQEGAFDTSFSTSVTSYTYAYVGSSASSVHLSATLNNTSYSVLYIDNRPQASGSTVEVGLSGASTVIPVRVEPYLLPPKTYTITVKRDSIPPEVRFSVNGNAAPSQSANTVVTVDDTESGVDAALLRYAWTQTEAAPVSGWTLFTSGQTLMKAGADGDWYLHIRATDMAGNVTDSVSHAFALDNTAPTATVSSSAGSTVNAAFPITVTFSEPVSGFSESGIVVSNAALSNFTSVTTSTYTATVEPILSGQPVTVQVETNAAADAAGNGNTASAAASFLYDTTKPTVTFGGFTAHQVFTAPPSEVTVTVSEAVYWAADGAPLTSANALAIPFITMEKDSVAFTAYSVSYDEPSRTFTLTFNGALGDGVYEMKLAGSVLKNASNNTLNETSASFTVTVPVVTGISAAPVSFASAGGNATVSITGLNLSGQTVGIYLDGAAVAAANVSNASNASGTVALPPNTTASDRTHTLTVSLNGAPVPGKSAVVTVSRAASSSGGGGSGSGIVIVPPAIDNNGISLDPAIIDTTKPSFILEVTPKDGIAYVNIPAIILTSIEGKNAAFFIEIKTPYGSYQVPVNLASLIPGLKDLLDKNNLRAEEISFRIVLTDKTGDKEIQTAFSNGLPNGKVMGAIVDFHIDIVNAKTRQKIGVADHFDKALTRIVPMPKNMSVIPVQWGAFRYNETAEKFEFVAAKKVRIDGVWYMMISSYTNSVYVVAQNAVSYTDVQKHWSRPFVELAAAKGLVEGVGGGLYNPDKPVTRAEFTAMLVRALGRGTAVGSTAPYDDVKSDAWYSNSVSKAQELGLLGFAKGKSFMPNQPLTREEMASMLAAVTKLEKLQISTEAVSLDGYKDQGSADAGYRDDVRLMVTLQIMRGTGEGTFSPKGETTRAQAAVVFIRMLESLGMVD